MGLHSNYKGPAQLPKAAGLKMSVYILCVVGSVYSSLSVLMFLPDHNN